MNRVFVVQNQHRWNRDKGELEPKFDLAPAEEYGEIRYVLGPTASPFSPDTVLPEMMEVLQDFGPGDHLLLIGNPILIGWATALAADANEGDISLLQWSGKDQKYISVEATLFDWPELDDEE